MEINEQEKRTTGSILAKLRGLVEDKKPVSPEEWIDAALFLEVLKFDENEKELGLRIMANRMYKKIYDNTKVVAAAKIEWETTKEWEDWQRQDRLVKDILEFVRIAKKQADIRKL